MSRSDRSLTTPRQISDIRSCFRIIITADRCRCSPWARRWYKTPINVTFLWHTPLDSGHVRPRQICIDRVRHPRLAVGPFSHADRRRLLSRPRSTINARVQSFSNNALISLTKVIKSLTESCIVTASRPTRALTTCGRSQGSGTNPVIYPRMSSVRFHQSIQRVWAKKDGTVCIIIIFLLRSSIAIILFKSLLICSSAFFFGDYILPSTVSIQCLNNGRVKKDV